jgi:transposase
MMQPNDLSRSLIPFEQDSTIVAVVEMSQSSWLVAAIVPGLGRHPLKKIEPDQEALLRLLRRWRDEAAGAGRAVGRTAVAFEAGRDGFWLARWLRAHDVEAHVIHPTSVAVSREHRRAKTDRLDTELLKRALERLERAPGEGRNAAVRLLARVVGVGLETADMLVHEVLSRGLRDRRAVARYAGLTGAPDESGAKRREKGLAKVGNARVRRGMIQLAWRFLRFQPDSGLARWDRARTADARGALRKTMIVALARKLLIGLWRLATTGDVPEGLVLRPAP